MVNRLCEDRRPHKVGLPFLVRLGLVAGTTRSYSSRGGKKHKGVKHKLLKFFRSAGENIARLGHKGASSFLHYRNPDSFFPRPRMRNLFGATVVLDLPTTPKCFPDP